MNFCGAQDPDMTLQVLRDAQTAESLTYQDM